MSGIISLKGIKKGFQGKMVLNGIDLEIYEGKITTMMGLSGSGKSVTMKLILGLLEPDEGEIYFRGKRISNVSFTERKPILKSFGVVFQNSALFDSMTLFENVAFPLREHYKFSEEEIEKRVLNVLDLVGLSGSENKFPEELSGGMRKRGGIARAIVTEPEVILYDEPTTGLDPVTGRVIEDLIVDLQKKYGHTAFIINHDVQSTIRMSDYVAFLYNGKIEFFGTPEEMEKSENEYLKQFISGRAVGPIKVG